MPGQCHYYDREGYSKSECLNRKSDEAGSQVTKETGGSQTPFTATTAKRGASDDWVIDSGASQHICAERFCFRNYE